ncbi:Protease transcriptional activator prtT [Abortiporus biennis]
MFSAQQHPPQPQSLQEHPPQPARPPVQRGARACSVCRAAKMKCVGGEEGVKPCQRCKRSGAECIFEKHRRGRKPGSKLSEASKVLRHLEKGLGDAKLKSQASTSQPSTSDVHSPFERFPNNELPPLNIPPDFEPGPSHVPHINSQAMDVDRKEETQYPRRSEGLYPAQLIKKESERTSFFKTILNPEPTEPSVNRNDQSSFTHPPPTSHQTPSPNVTPALNSIFAELSDPIAAGLIEETHANTLFDLFYLRLNPFINLFDRSLHTAQYVRTRCPFLFTTLIMVCCKFFKPDQFHSVQRLTQLYTLRAFAENWKSVEVVQAFICLTYWKEPDDTRTWTYIGYACRMAVELGLNRFVGKPLPEESDLEIRERRSRERTYLLLFIHDRSLSFQTGRQWMLPEDDLVRHALTWHSDGPLPTRPEDVIVASFVQLQRISSETTEAFHSERPGELNHDNLLRSCNGKLTQWMDTWQHEMRRAGGLSFHHSFLNLFRLNIRLFLNSFGVQTSMTPSSRSAPSLQALSACYNSAVDVLQIVTKDFAATMLRYTQESISVMTAYASVFLIRMLRSANTLAELHEGAVEEVHTTISRVADAYHEVAANSPVLTSAAYHARFLRGLVETDILRLKQQAEGDRRASFSSSPEMYRKPLLTTTPANNQFNFAAPSSSRPTQLPPILPSYPALPGARENEYVIPSPGRNATTFPPTQSPQQMPVSESDANYWRNMFRDLGLGDGFEPLNSNIANPNSAAYGQSPSSLHDGGPGSSSGSAMGVSGIGYGYANHNGYQPSYNMSTYPPPPPTYGA